MEIDSKILAALERIQTAAQFLLQQQSHSHGLSPLQVRILALVLQDEAKTVSAIAKNLLVSKATVSEAVRTLESKNLIRKIASAADSRSYSVELTPRGSELAHITAAYDTPLQKTLLSLKAEQKDSLWESLLHLIGFMEKQDLIPYNRMCLTCTHCGRDVNDSKYYCNLMKTPLSVSSLRINCPEHQAR